MKACEPLLWATMRMRLKIRTLLRARFFGPAIFIKHVNG